jgi:xanthine dehydrogenase accessory factor
MRELRQILELLCQEPAQATVLATLVSVKGSSYRRPGARLLLTQSSRTFGSISGGCLEDDVVAHAKSVMIEGIARVLSYDTTTENDLLWGVGLGCHGVVDVLIERLMPGVAWPRSLRDNLLRRQPTELAVTWKAPDPSQLGTRILLSPPGEFLTDRNKGVGSPVGAASTDVEVFYQTIPPPPSLVVFGAGNDAQPLVRFARDLGWDITVVDPRPAYADPLRFPEADTVIVARPGEIPGGVPLGPDTLAVVMTHHYAHDLPLLRALLPRPLAYLGLLGPRKRSEKILADLGTAGLAITAQMRRRLHAPVGLDLGADAPEGVALAILAEMLATLSARDGRPLRDRKRPIHG